MNTDPAPIGLTTNHTCQPPEGLMRCDPSGGRIAPNPPSNEDIAGILEVLEYQRLEIKDLRKKIKNHVRKFHTIKI